jgi:hypothetical protein
MRLNRQLLTGTMAVVFGLTVAGCKENIKVTGGGWIPAKYDEDVMANFGFNGESCKPGVRGQFNYHDRSDDLKAKGYVTGVIDCSAKFAPSECRHCKTAIGEYVDDDNTLIAIQFDYRSTNPHNPGEGEGFACVIDNGEGVNATSADFAAIGFRYGPYDQYVNKGSVQGNIQEHSCKPADNG